MIDYECFHTIVRTAGDMALALWPGHGHAPAVWEKTPGSPVCDADIAVDAFLKRELGALLPSAGWLSEETVDHPDRLERGLCWLVDPVDGTRDFVRGRPGWAVSVALVSEGRPLIGALSAPARGEYWAAIAGQGATRNGLPLQASTRTVLAGSRVPADALPAPDADLVIVDKPNSIALRIAMVGADEADLLATLRWGFEWDIAAATLIAREAGAATSDAFGKPLAYNKRDPRDFGLLVSAPAIHAAAVERLAERAAKLA
ncbi:MAG: 3'(2'),5'-bisphosphate nucleotidase CysQ [Novosphingobium sp. 28-62-57]|uniref:3'(2'),5'-bisphosphate nucleotidase CysQ n=1 Tax=unclassified Novosphingobium TaxID=2644732 RepID=UPI000BDD6D7D|nr:MULTISPECIES: 3'(2'),5'-bisphosphate nucleotidase CysQ [unclassified Novosphingobium]OYW48388.1 MAG: 3'(2'),5'-bisphosphate nucleotidase CysQ [Novosphingobium sp. 12-62-10]OYZ09251.1 MAG: 3'(2'),5'-bisphosphate nucleotidase CysQ [Novosphingobium sp. 28-62-57]OZA36088.1 MAG: 3'(2'),5'-bisphosphate nucleotidase CysQ [Novosphingobium sp. 17-62-9]HQS69508.1 3'(2'),5'-bisphosphate nucleotidase CysQ [Novosphingobium sp.]